MKQSDVSVCVCDGRIAKTAVLKVMRKATKVMRVPMKTVFVLFIFLLFLTLSEVMRSSSELR